VGDGRPEQGHDAVADVFVDAAAIALDDAVDEPEEPGQQGMDLLGVELVGELGVVGQVGEQHRHLSPLAVGKRRDGDVRRRLGAASGGRSRRRRARVAQGGNCIEELATMPDRGHPDRHQVLGGQSRQHLGVDIVNAERLSVIRQAQIPQPARDEHGWRPG